VCCGRCFGGGGGAKRVEAAATINIYNRCIKLVFLSFIKIGSLNNPCLLQPIQRIGLLGLFRTAQTVQTGESFVIRKKDSNRVGNVSSEASL
jgi:hypothetical protein